MRRVSLATVMDKLPPGASATWASGGEAASPGPAAPAVRGLDGQAATVVARSGREPAASGRSAKRRASLLVRGGGGPGACRLRWRGRAGLDHEIHLARVQRPGLALTGYTDYIRYGRVQIMGGSEIGYLRKLGAARRRGRPGAGWAAAASPASW